MSQIRAIEKLIKEDPNGEGWAGRTDAATLTRDMNVAVLSGQTGKVLPKIQRLWLGQSGRHERLAWGVQSGATEEVRGLCRSALLLAGNEDEYNPAIHGGLGLKLVSASIFSSADINELHALAPPVKVIDNAGLSTLSHGQVWKALNNIAKEGQ